MHPSERGDKLLTAIIESRDEEAAKLMKQDVDLSRMMKGDNAIHLIARRGNLPLLKKMKEKGADMEQKNENGNTAMHYAAKEGYLHLIRYLKQQKANLNATNKDGETPLHMAVISQSMDMVEEMVSLGMKVNTKSPVTGQTPLHQALKFGRQEAMEALLINGAAVKVKDKDGKRAEDVGKTKDIRESLRMYGALLIAMEAGFIQARGLKLSRDLVAQPFTVDRTDVIIDHIDIPSEMIPSFYCRREKVENSSVNVGRFEQEQVLSDVFFIRITDCNRDCPTKLYLPLYSAKSDKEELVLRILNSEQETQGPITIEKAHTEHKRVYCPLETKLVPETTVVCVVYVRPKQEENVISESGSLIKSTLQKDFEMDVPAGAFDEETTLSLTVFDSDDSYMEETSDENTGAEDQASQNLKQKHGANSLLSSVYQINVTGGKQPSKGVMIQLPFSKGMENADDIAIVHADEQQFDTRKEALEVVKTKPKIVGSNIIFEVSHFSIYVAAPRESVMSLDEMLVLRRQISDVREKRKPGVFFAVCRQLEGLKHLVMVECVMFTKGNNRREHWVGKQFETQTPDESEAIMMKSGDTFTIEIKGNASLEDEHEAQERRLQFSQCRSSFQPYSVLLDKSVQKPEQAVVELIVFKHMDDKTRKEVTRLQVRLHVPPQEKLSAKDIERYQRPKNLDKSPFTALKNFFKK